jgi:hypothetical protein
MQEHRPRFLPVDNHRSIQKLELTVMSEGHTKYIAPVADEGDAR